MLRLAGVSERPFMEQNSLLTRTGTYLPFICWDVIEAGAWYLLGVETRGRTCELFRQ
jgi:hypothetical protein